MRRILVTGAGGFLAGPLIADLGKGPARIFKIGLSAAPGISSYDLTDPVQARAAVAFARPDEVYHLAGTTRARAWDDVWRAHVSSTVNLLDALGARGAHVRVVVTGSSAEYGAAGGKRPREDSPGEPLTLYGACKRAQTCAALSFARGPVSVVAARIFNVLGPGTPENLAPGAFARQIARVAAGLQSPEIAVGDLSPRRDYIDVRDVASALKILMRKGASGRCYNVGSGRSLPMNAILRGLADAAGVAVRPRLDPARARRSEVRDLVADARRLRALGWAPRVPLQTSLQDTVGEWLAR